jgi:hypothetical protein
MSEKNQQTQQQTQQSQSQRQQLNVSNSLITQSMSTNAVNSLQNSALNSSILRQHSNNDRSSSSLAPTITFTGSTISPNNSTSNFNIISSNNSSTPILSNYGEQMSPTLPQQQSQPQQFIATHGHFFVKKTFHKPTYCHHCTEMLWGLIGQGLTCEG